VNSSVTPVAHGNYSASCYCSHSPSKCPVRSIFNGNFVNFIMSGPGQGSCLNACALSARKNEFMIKFLLSYVDSYSVFFEYKHKRKAEFALSSKTSNGFLNYFLVLVAINVQRSIY